MTTDHPAVGNGSAARLQSARYLRCVRCGVPQPLVSADQYRCVSCGAPLQRWIAHPPPGTDPAILSRATRARSAGSRPESRLPYLGPPAYQGGHPRWSFPPVVWKDAPDPPAPPRRDPAPALRRAGWSAAVTAVVAGCAAGAEIWRFILLLQGRTLVLSGAAVRASDVLVAATGLAVVVAALTTVVFAVPAVVRAHEAAARRIGRAPSRPPAAVAARLLVPLWNVYGAGQIAMEIDRMLQEGADQERNPQSRPRHRQSRLTTAWWCGWIVSAVLVLVTLARGLGGSLQAIADTVQLHIAVDLAAAVVAVLTALLLRRFAGLFDGRRDRLAGWVVQPPQPTRPLPEPTPASAGRSSADRSSAERATSERTSSGRASSELAASELAASELAASGQTSSEQTSTDAASANGAPAKPAGG